MAIVTVLKDQKTLASAVAERVTSLVETSIMARRGASICLTGGRTPAQLYEQLADNSRPWRSRIDWTRVHVYWGDERQVPPDDPESNFGMAHRTLLAHVPIPADHVHRIRGELPDPAEAAREYAMTLRAAGAGNARGPEGSAPHVLFDVTLLGLGEDAHVASIFPNSPLLAPQSAAGAGLSRPGGDAAVAVWAGHLGAWRISLTPSALLGSRAIVVLVSGSKKAPAVRAALNGPEDVMRWPGQILRAAGARVEWFMDAAARWHDAPLS